MTNIINLRQARKSKARTQKEKTASENRAKFGRTKADRQLEKKKADQSSRHIEGHKRDNHPEK